MGSSFQGTTFTNENIKFEIGNPESVIYDPVYASFIKAEKVAWKLEILGDTGWEALEITPTNQTVQDINITHVVTNRGLADNGNFSYQEAFTALIAGPSEQPLYCELNFSNIGSRHVFMRFKLLFEGIPFDKIQLQWRDWDEQVNITSILELQETTYFSNLQANALVVFNDLNQKQFGLNWAPFASYFAGLEARPGPDPSKMDLMLHFGPAPFAPNRVIGEGWWIDSGGGGGGSGGSGGGSGDGKEGYKMYDLEVTQAGPSGEDVTISWTTSKAVSAELHWGLTQDYGGKKSRAAFQTNHVFTLSHAGGDIDSHKVYYFKAVGYREGYNTNWLIGYFTTGLNADVDVPYGSTIDFEIYIRNPGFQAFIFYPKRSASGDTTEIYVHIKYSEDTMSPFDLEVDHYPVVLKTQPSNPPVGEDGHVWDHISFGLIDGYGKMTISMKTHNGCTQLKLQPFEDSVEGFIRPYTTRTVNVNYENKNVKIHAFTGEGPVVSETDISVSYVEIPVLYFRKSNNIFKIPVLYESQKSRIVIVQAHYWASEHIREEKHEGGENWCVEGWSQINKFEARLPKLSELSIYSKVEGVEFDKWVHQGELHDYTGDMLTMQLIPIGLNILAFAFPPLGIASMIISIALFLLDMWQGQDPSSSHLGNTANYWRDGWDNVHPKEVHETYLTWMFYVDTTGTTDPIQISIPVMFETYVDFWFGGDDCVIDYNDDDEYYEINFTFDVDFIISNRDD